MAHDESAVEEYDWRGVEQQLASMRQKRSEAARQRLAADTSQTARFKPPSPALCVAEDFELKAVDDFDGNSSSSESESDLNGGRHAHGSGRPLAQKSAGKKRLKDSLDLSMSESVADLRPFLPRERHQAAQSRNTPSLSPPISPIAPPPATCAAGINQSSSSALIQRRRQLEQEAAMAKDESDHAQASDVGCVKAALATAGSNASRLQSKIVQPSSRLQRGSEVVLPANTHSHVEPKAQSHLVAPMAISARAREVLKKPMASNQDQTAIPTASSRLAMKPTAAAAVPMTSSIAAGLPSTSRAPQWMEPEDDESALHSEEETKLLRSLENLDTRLTRLAVAKPPAKSGEDNQKPKSNKHRDDHVDRRKEAIRPGLKRADSPQEDCAPDDDEELIRRAAYGGGTHHRSLQQTSPSVRTSCLKRAEISGSLPRARVRPGAPSAAETTINRDADGRHKVVVKKDLAHLLFFN